MKAGIEPVRRVAWRSVDRMSRGMVLIAFCSGLTVSAIAGQRDSLAEMFEGTIFPLQDENDDGFVTDADVALTIYRYFQVVDYRDMDGDGLITAADTILAIEAIILAAFVDPAMDGVVGEEDLQAFADDTDSGAHAIRSDFNLDGVVDAADLQILLGLLGEDTNIQGKLSAAQDIYIILGEIEELGEQAFADATVIANRDHTQVWSSTYPGTHKRSVSSKFPANHSYIVSIAWPDNNHSLALSKDSWPPSHGHVVSSGWNDPPKDEHEHDGWVSSNDSTHHTGQSYEAHIGIFSAGTSPPYRHLVLLSEQWREVPNHHAAASHTWPRPPSHDGIISRTWPGTHFAELSEIGDPPFHLTESSVHWGPGPDHGVERSERWPPNHFAPMSPSWPPNHSGGRSSTWPPNHASIASYTWPPHIDPPPWPPNHFEPASTNENQPEPRQPGLFPPDHAWLPSWRLIVPG